MFEDKGDKRTRVINSYDNAVYYNDFIVDSVFSMLKTYSLLHPKVRVSALYFSDHGENVYDEGDYCGHNYTDKIPCTNVEIPFVLWLSPSQKEYLDAHNCLTVSRLHTPYMIDDLFHTIIDLCNIATPCFDKTRSFINQSFDSTRQRILEDGNVYGTNETN